MSSVPAKMTQPTRGFRQRRRHPAAQHRDDPSVADLVSADAQHEQHRCAEQQQRRHQHHEDQMLHHVRPEEGVVIGAERAQQRNPGEGERGQEARRVVPRPSMIGTDAPYPPHAREVSSTGRDNARRQDRIKRPARRDRPSRSHGRGRYARTAAIGMVLIALAACGSSGGATGQPMPGPSVGQQLSRVLSGAH